ncbi:alanine racemase C-terminal domain-containing protein [Tropheryma whipplei]|uniref:alanine racemase C-terminal domain-containing protein n=1 Tax=Tropheryma whipplei TaxID=2039 RepID=UPI0004B44BAF|nr:alanine racemase C-terminal domain-containing protein [Tropheryma whipplei]MCO8182521.1 alanine racemase [Tropheryma whipplei]MCO8190011.1 alanine racemase [Tropheryma whipplei]
MISRLATITLESIKNNALLCLEADGDITVDLRADAFGHGLVKIAYTLYSIGVRKCFVRKAHEKIFLEEIGFTVDVSDAPIKPFSHDIYGLGDNTECKAALHLESCVVTCKKLPAGAGVSYCHTYRTQSEENVALIGIGYADGLPFQAQGSVEIKKRKYPIIGRIAMDYMVAKVTPDSYKHGTRVTVWGESGAKTWGLSAGIDPLCLTAGLAYRVEKRWLT